MSGSAIYSLDTVQVILVDSTTEVCVCVHLCMRTFVFVCL